VQAERALAEQHGIADDISKSLLQHG